MLCPQLIELHGGEVMALGLALPRCSKRVDNISVTPTYCNHNDYKFAITHFVHQPISHAAQLYFVAAVVAAQFSRRHMRIDQAFGQFFLELGLSMSVKFAPLFQGIFQERQFKGH